MGMDLRNEYFKLSIFSQIPGLEDEAIEIKRRIREYTNRTSDRTIVRDYGIDGFVSLIELPEYLKSEEDATEYFEETEYIPSRCSLYDCTGRAFTQWYKIIKRRGRFLAYHSVGIDI